MKKLFEIDWLKYLTWGLLLAMAGFVIKAWENPPMPAAIYWFELEFLSLRRQLACLCIPVFLFLACIWVIRQEKTRGVRVWIPVVLLFSNILACAAAMPGLLAVNEHQDSTVFENRVYYVMTSYGTLGLGGVTGFYAYFYECDQLGLFC